MIEKDDGFTYWVRTAALVWANDQKQPTSRYWLSFRAAALELHREYETTVELPTDLVGSWYKPSFEKLLNEYALAFPGEIKKIDMDKRRERAFEAMSRFHVMKSLGAFVGSPVTIKTVGDGQTVNGDDSHVVEISGQMWRYRALDGNHRLMSAMYVGVSAVPVIVVSFG